MNILIYVVAGAIGVFLSYVGIVFAVLGGPQFAYLIGGLLLTAHIGAIFYVHRKAKQGKGRQAAIVLVLPLPLVMGVMYLFTVGKYAISFLEQEPPEFTKACQDAGVQFYKLPEQSVHSVAYDWETKIVPTYSSFSLGFGGRVNSLGRSDLRYPRCPNGITFVERRHSDREGLPPGSPGPYVRFPCTGPFYGITALTADVLVKYRVTPEEELRKAENHQGMVVYELTVTDRRDGEKLAFLRYVIDAKNRRACGLTENNAMNERAFVLKAIGIQ